MTSTPALLFVGTAVAGLGFGPAFMDAYRSTVALAPPDDRAALITAVYIVSYRRGKRRARWCGGCDPCG